MSSAYLAWIRRQPCLGCGIDPAGEAHHVGRHGVGQKPPDEQAVPLCHACHMAFHDLTGPFRGFERRHLKVWESLVLTATRNRFLAAASKRAAPAEKLCDYPLTGSRVGETCGRPICDACATTVGRQGGATIDYCRVHAERHAKSQGAKP